jgi:hypothetical protein
VLGLAVLPAGAQVADSTPPEVTCDSDDGTWHAVNVSIACTASDPESGIPNPSDQSFNLTTSVPLGQETSNALTDSRNVCNGEAVPLCTEAGPIAGNMIDRKSPNDPTKVRSTDHRIGKWSRDRTITMVFNAATDGGSGVDGFSWTWTDRLTGVGSIPDMTIDLEQGERQLAYGPFNYGRFYFHLRTVDNVGNWTSTVHRGPYLIDFTKPHVRALSNSGITGKKIRLRYRTDDNSHRTREKLTLSKGGSIIERWSKPMARARLGVVQDVDWTPKAAGNYKFCVKALDRAGNSRQDCAGIVVKRPSGGGGGGGRGGCDPSYPGVCIPPPPPDLDCDDIHFRDFRVRPPDPHNFDADHDGRGCES